MLSTLETNDRDTIKKFESIIEKYGANYILKYATHLLTHMEQYPLLIHMEQYPSFQEEFNYTFWCNFFMWYESSYGTYKNEQKFMKLNRETYEWEVDRMMTDLHRKQKSYKK